MAADCLEHTNDISEIVFVDDVCDCEIVICAMVGGVRAGLLASNTAEEDTPADIWVTELRVESAFRRRGIASALMGEFERRHGGLVIDHGERTDDGVAWARHYYGHNARFTHDGEPVGSARCARYVHPLDR